MHADLLTGDRNANALLGGEGDESLHGDLQSTRVRRSENPPLTNFLLSCGKRLFLISGRAL